MEVIQLIPIIIQQLKQGGITKSEKISLEKIFGDSLWSLIIAEASRNSDSEMNPLLKTILNSEEVRLAKRDITSQIGNDIYKNSLRRVYRGGLKSSGDNSPKPYISLDDDRKLLSPSERLLNMIAAIIHKSTLMEKKTSKLRHNKRYLRKMKALNGRKKENPLGIVTIEQKPPRQRYVDRILGINRMKRSLIKIGTDLDDMKTLLDQVNHESDSNELLMNDDEDEYDENQNQQHLSNDDYEISDDYQLDSSNDYQYEWNSRHYRNIYDDYENGSVNEFINLSRQRDRREKSFIEDDYQEDDYEAYDDDN